LPPEQHHNKLHLSEHSQSTEEMPIGFQLLLARISYGAAAPSSKEMQNADDKQQLMLLFCWNALASDWMICRSHPHSSAELRNNEACWQQQPSAPGEAIHEPKLWQSKTVCQRSNSQTTIFSNGTLSQSLNAKKDIILQKPDKRMDGHALPAC
jgi:hypothetical protein